MADVLHVPNREHVVTSNAWAFLHWLRTTRGIDLADWAALQRWSATDAAAFGAAIAAFARLPDQPFNGSDLSVWLTSPLAQDLMFGGVIYRLLRPHFSGYIHPRVKMEWALPVGGIFFAAWHLQNFATFPREYVLFQLVYTWAAFTFVGLTRQWTGSILYVDLAHMAGNFVPWYVSPGDW